MAGSGRSRRGAAADGRRRRSAQAQAATSGRTGWASKHGDCSGILHRERSGFTLTLTPGGQTLTLAYVNATSRWQRKQHREPKIRGRGRDWPLSALKSEPTMPQVPQVGRHLWLMPASRQEGIMHGFRELGERDLPLPLSWTSRSRVWRIASKLHSHPQR